MILADTSIWIDHLRAGEPTLARLLNNSAVLGHPCVVGELATWLRQGSADTRLVAEYLGHADLSTVARYAHVADDELHDAAEQLAQRAGYALNA